MNNTRRRLLGARRLLNAAWLMIALLTLSISARMFAQETSEDFVEPRITRTQFATFLAQLNLGSEQRNIAQLAFTDYTDALTELSRTLDQQAVTAGRQSVNDALAGKARVSPDDLKRMRIAVLKVYPQGWPTIDRALDTLLSSIESVLTAEQGANFSVAVRQLRREIFLHPRQAASDYQEYAGDGVDVLQLADAALADGGELQPMGSAPIQDILTLYEQQLDALLISTAAEYRAGKLNRKIASIEKDSAAIHHEEQAALDRWKQLYQLNGGVVHQIGELAASAIDDAARQHWLDRYDRASFTWLYPRRKPDRQIEWIRLQSVPGLSEEKHQQSEATYENYLQRRRALARQAIDIMIRGRLEFQTMLYSMMDPSGMDDRVRRGLYEELLKNSGEQANLETTTSASLESLLNDAQREALREALKKPDRAARKH